MFKKDSKIIKNLFSITSIVIITKIFGLLKQIVIAKTFGANIETDLIALSEGFISNADYAIVQTLVTAFVSTYIYAISQNQSHGKQLVADTLKCLIVFSILFSVGIIIFSPLISRILAPSYDSYLSSKLCNYIKVFAPLFTLVLLKGLFQAILNANDKYVPVELVGTNQSLITIVIVLVLFSYLDVKVLVIASYTSCIYNLFFLIVCSRKYLYVKKGNPFNNPDISRMLKMMGPLLISYSMVFINQQVDKNIVSGLGAGTITSMHYAQVLSNLICALITSISTMIFTKLTQLLSCEKIEDAGILAVKSGILFCIFIVPISIVTVLCAEEIVSTVFGWGAYGAEAVKKTTLALKGYGFMFVFYAIKILFSRFQYGNKNTILPMINNSVGIFSNILLSIILSKFIGVLGVTLATSIAEFVAAILNIISAKRINKYIKISKQQKIYILIIFLGALVSILICYITKEYIVINNNFIRLVVYAGITIICYTAIVFYPAIKFVKR